MSKNSEYVATYAELAEEQMRRYGIPASVILAQGILESTSGQSELSRKGNNHFGIKCTASWLQTSGKYLVYTDDRPNEKFCVYDTVRESYEHHSLFLKENARYKSCFSLSSDDYKGWTEGLQTAGYATGANYAKSLQQIIEKNGLHKYDQQVMEDMRMQGKSFGIDSNPYPGNSLTLPTSEIQYAFPLECKEFMLVTSPFGMRQDPMDASKQQMHKGVDIRANHDKLFATENGGKVIGVNENSKTAGGKSVTVEYVREDGSKLQVAYSHLDSLQVRVGDVLKAGQQLGISGDTGTRCTGPHLHLGVQLVAPDGNSRDLDPASYMAEIAQKGNLKQQVLYNGENLLAKYEKAEELQEGLSSSGIDKTLSADDWMKKLLSSEDSGIGMSGDPIMEIITSLFTGLMALATQLDGDKSKEEQMQQVTNVCLERKIDITPLVAGAKDCKIVLSEGGKPILHADINGQSITHVFSNTETNSLLKVLNNQDVPDSEKQLRITSLVNGIVAQEQVSRNYEQGRDMELGRGESMQIK